MGLPFVRFGPTPLMPRATDLLGHPLPYMALSTRTTAGTESCWTASRPSTYPFPITRSALNCVRCSYTGYYDGGLTGGAVMFHRGGLANTSHTVIITNLGETPTNFWGLDYVVVNHTVPREGGSVAQASNEAAVGAKTSATSSFVTPPMTSTTSTTPTTPTPVPTLPATPTSAVPDIAATRNVNDITGDSVVPAVSSSPGSTNGTVLGGSSIGASRTDNG